MALFKIFKGNDTAKLTDSTATGYKVPTDGYAYYDTSSKLFYIDAEYPGATGITRQPINAAKAGIAGTALNGIFYGTCTTAQSTKAKVAIIEDSLGFALQTGTIVVIKFTYASAASTMTLTLQDKNSNTIGAAHNLELYGTTVMSSSTTTTGWQAGAVVPFVYDGANWIRFYWANSTYSSCSFSPSTQATSLGGQTYYKAYNQISQGLVPSYSNIYGQFPSESAALTEATKTQDGLIFTGKGWRSVTTGPYQIVYSNSSSQLTRLYPNTSATKKFLSMTGMTDPSWASVSKDDVGLGNVENTALSSWTGSNQITTLGTIGTGTWQGSTIEASYLPTATTSAKGIVQIGSGLSVNNGTVSVNISDLGLSTAMHFKGTTTTAMSDGLTTADVTIGGSLYTPSAGDVVLYSDSEFVWTGSAWERLGRDSSFKTTQSAVSSPSADGSTTAFIDTISQNANGVITVTKKNLDTSGTWSGNAATATTATKLGTVNKGSATKPIYLSAGAPTECTTYAGGTAVTLNNSNKAGNTASFYAPTAGGTQNIQALVGDGATAAPKWVNISPDITITAGTASAAPQINVTVLGQSGTAKSITTATTGVYGVTKLNSAINSTSTTEAATPSAVKSAYDLANNHKYWANVEATSAATYNVAPEMATLKLNGNTSATAASTSNVTLVYDTTLQALNFVFA